MICIPETAHTIGLALLVFYVLPDIDVVKGAMLTNCLCFIPGVLGKLLHFCVSKLVFIFSEFINLFYARPRDFKDKKWQFQKLL